jgi:hypothetical protein
MVPTVASEKIPSDTTGDRSGDIPNSALSTTLPQALILPSNWFSFVHDKEHSVSKKSVEILEHVRHSGFNETLRSISLVSY